MQAGTGGLIQITGDGDSEGVTQRHSVAGEGFRQQPHLPKVKKTRPALVINAEVAYVHVGLGEDQPLLADTDRCYAADLCGLVQVMC